MYEELINRIQTRAQPTAVENEDGTWYILELAGRVTDDHPSEADAWRAYYEQH